MGTYRLVRAIDRGYPLAFFWLYVGAFVIAMALMFVFPPGALALMGLGLASLAVVVIGKKALGVLVRWLARSALGGGTCPACGRPAHRTIDDGPWRCDECAAAFDPSGAEA